jgi:hypothetical protein
MSKRTQRQGGGAYSRSPSYAKIKASAFSSLSSNACLNLRFGPPSGLDSWLWSIPRTDSLRFYFLGANWQRRVEQYGAKAAYDPVAPLIL